MRLLDAVTGELEDIARRSGRQGLAIHKPEAVPRGGFIRRGVKPVKKYLKGRFTR